MSTEQEQLEAGIAALEGQRAVLGNAAVDAAIEGLRARLAALRAGAVEPDQKRKQTTILFLDVVGSTALGQALDPEEIAVVMDGFLARGASAVAAHGGRVLKYAGDSLLAVFGAQQSMEDDAERAVRCGLALRDLGKTFGAEVRDSYGHAGVDVRVGVHTGDVLLGGGVDEESSIRGQAVNVAARMEQTAPPGSVRISHDSYRLVRGLFDVAVQEPLLVKGIDEPVRTYLVLRAKPRAFAAASRGVEGVDTHMIGRDAELRALQDAFARAARPGAGAQRVVVVGEAGVGKSRLLHEFGRWAASRAERVDTLHARATPQTQAQPYGMLRDLVASRWQIHDGDSMEVARRKLEDGVVPLFADDEGAEGHVHMLGQLIGLDYGDSRHIRGIGDDAAQIRKGGFYAAARLLRRLVAQDGSVLVVQLDDLHWADDGSLDWIDYVAQVDRDVAMLIVAVARPTLFERPHACLRFGGGPSGQRIDLEPLDEAGRRLLADELLGKLTQVPDGLRELLVRAADGNPFYMEELVNMLVDEGAIVTTGERWTFNGDTLALKVPSTLTGVLQARLDSLPAEERRALQLASVIGVDFWEPALAHVDAQATVQLPSLAARELVRSVAATDGVGADGTDAYAFRHQILHQVTYDTVLKRVRREAHARVADWLAHHAGARSRSMLGAAAEHYERAGDVPAATEFYTLAAEHMAEMSVHDAALDYATRGLAVADAGADDLRWRLLVSREWVLGLLGRREAQAADLEALHALADAMPPGASGDTRRAYAAYRRSDLAHRTGDWATQEREARRAQALAERAGDESMALRAIARLAQALAYQGDPRSGQAVAEAGLVRARRLDSPARISGMLNALTVCTDLLGDRVAGLKNSLVDLSLNREAASRLNEAVALSNVGMSYLGFGVFDEARRHLHDALRLNRAMGNRQIEGNTHSMLSELEWREGNGELALSHAQAAYDISVEVDSRLHQIDSLWSLGNAQLALGRWSAASEAFERSEALARDMGMTPHVLNALDGRIRVALARGDDVLARDLADRLLDEAARATPASGGSRPSLPPLAGTYEHLVRLSLCRVYAGFDEARARQLLDDSHAALVNESARIDDVALKQSFLTRIAEHREILALRAQATRSRGEG
jgi:class 3 adenylate cyclase/tetratricopeptide (TPR) repeat protein